MDLWLFISRVEVAEIIEVNFRCVGFIVELGDANLLGENIGTLLLDKIDL